MTDKYKEYTDVHIHGNQRADEMAKEARDNALLEEINIPRTIHEGEKYAIHEKRKQNLQCTQIP